MAATTTSLHVDEALPQGKDVTDGITPTLAELIALR